MIKALLDEIVSHDDKGAVVPISRFEDLRREMEELKSEVHHVWSDWMAEVMSIGEPGFTPRSLIAVITPSPKVMLQFNDRGRVVHCVMPPYYTGECTVGVKVLQYINAFLTPLGFSAADTGRLPLKLLAVRCGLARYGRNNISYSAEFGSHMRLLAYVSDLPCGDAPWFETRRMEKCETCRACVEACPMGAMDLKQRVINASVCLTQKNENPGEFPDWIPEDAHNSLIGCMKCQDCCPGNGPVKDRVIRGTSFTEEETAEILNHKGDKPYSAPLAAKLEEAGINPDFWPLLPRNLSVLLKTPALPPK